ncbi:uncharacterized protein JCM6883_003881 [Sporobolomyces salmoneus]|uniref:uncharacterized protein n=1 Tax=Sporobolomyces salmoneus TaxID=183962 RepID=UPI00317C2754
MTSISSYGARVRPPNPLAADPEWIHRRFERAVDIIQSLPKSGPIQTNYDDKLLLYACYKQATEGNIKTSRPGMFDVLGRAKWDAWNKRKGMSQQDAERMYVEALIRILRGYSDRTQAVELMKVLETFTLERPKRRTIAGGPGSSKLALSRTRSSSSSGSSSTSSSSSMDYDRPSRSNSTPQPSRTSRHRSSGNRIQPPPADLVAPPLPGYGPPRTRTDSVRRREATESEEEAESYSSGSEEEDRRHYASIPPTAPSSVINRTNLPPPHLSAVSNLPTRSTGGGGGGGGTHSLTGNNSPSPSVYSINPHHQQQQPSQSRRHPPIDYAQSHSHQQQLAFHPPPTSSQPLVASTPPLTTSNLLLQRPISLTPQPPAQAQTDRLPVPVPVPALDAALDRIQTSLTALHERLTILESSPSSTRSHSHSITSLSQLSSNSPISVLLKHSFLQLLFLFHLKSPAASSSSPSSSTKSSLRALRSLIPSLGLALLKKSRKLVGDLVVALMVLIVLGRFRGVNLVGVMGEWVVRWVARRQGSIAGGTGGRRIEGV